MKNQHVGRSRIYIRPCGVTGTMTVQRAVFGGWTTIIMDGMKSGASGKKTGAGNITEHGKCLE